MQSVFSRYRKLIFAIVAVLLTWAACAGAYSYAFSVDLIDWDCGGGSCATNDVRSLGMPVAVMGIIAASVLGGFAVGLIGPAISIASVAFWFRQGVLDAVAAGNTPEHTIGVPMTISTVGFVLAGICFICWIPMFWGNMRVRIKVAQRQKAADQS